MAKYVWRGIVSSAELNQLHAQAFGTRLYVDEEWPWEQLLAEHSLGWVTARDGDRLVGFVNVIWDGLVHAWLPDTMVDPSARHRSVGQRVVALAHQQAAAAGSGAGDPTLSAGAATTSSLLARRSAGTSSPMNVTVRTVRNRRFANSGSYRTATERD